MSEQEFSKARVVDKLNAQINGSTIEVPGRAPGRALITLSWTFSGFPRAGDEVSVRELHRRHSARPLDGSYARALADRFRTSHANYPNIDGVVAVATYGRAGELKQ